MEGRKSFVEELFPTNKSAEAARRDNLSSIFQPRPPTVSGKGSAHNPESRKAGADGLAKKKNGKPSNLYEFTDSGLMSSSVHYGGRDDFITDTAPANYNSGAHYSHMKNKEDDSGDSEAATRGDWWQGSFHY